MTEQQRQDLIDVLGKKLHKRAQEQSENIFYGPDYVDNEVDCCRVDAEINFYDLAAVAIDFMEE